MTSVLTHDDDILIIDFNLRPAVFAEEHAIAHFEVGRAGLPTVHHLASAHGDDLAEGGHFTGGVRNDDPAGRLRLFGLALETTRSCKRRMVTTPPMELICNMFYT